MQVDVKFSNARVYNVDKKIDVVKGETFELITDLEEPTKWFSDEDQVLEILQKGNSALLTADETGTSTILIVGTNFGIIKELVITVVEDIDPAVALEVKAGPAINK